MDRRVKYTQKVIKETFINLLEQKDLKKVTVSEICEQADINRATFYRYYLDVYDLYDKIKNELIDDLRAAADSEDDYTVYHFASDMLKVLISHKDIINILFINSNNIYFLNEFLEVAYEKCKHRWRLEDPNISEEIMEYAAIFIFNGALGIINYWVQNNFDKDINEIAKMIESLAYFGIKNASSKLVFK